VRELESTAFCSAYSPTINAISVHVIAAILRVILNHGVEHLVGALAECDLPHKEDCYFPVMLV
jgi:hypothetical protein